MAYVYDNKTYRNLQQQVKENMENIAELQDLKLVGIDVAGIVADSASLPSSAQQGQVYAVGTSSPYELYVYNNSSWVNFGQFPKAGPQGDQGPQGEPGRQGPRGLTGEQGPRGYTGAPGTPGQAGPAGEKGPKGDKGDPGPQGPAGQDGTVSFDELTPAQLDMLKGPKGDTGPQGPRGLQGEQGPIGPQGPVGQQGPKGDPGEVPADVATKTYVDTRYTDAKNYTDQTIVTALNGYATETYVDSTRDSVKDYTDKEIAKAKLAITSEIPTKTSQLTNDSNFVTSTELSTVAFSGNYNDLIGKPTITNVSGVNDGTNWTSLTIGSDTYGLGGGGSETSIEVNGQLYNADAEGKITLPNYPALPENMVNSVNGKYGVVTLYAKDITAENTNTIQANLDRLDSDITRVEASIPDTSGFITSTELNAAIQTKQDILVNSKDTVVDVNKVTTVYGGGYTDVEKRLYHNCPKLETYNTKYNNYTGTNTSDITWMNEHLVLNSEYPMILRLFTDESNFVDYEGTWTVSSNYKSDGTMNIPALGINGVRMYTNDKSMFAYLTKEQTNNAVAVQISISAETYTEQVVNPIDPKWMPETGLVKSVNGLEGYVTLSANEIAANNGASIQSNLKRIDADISRVEGEIPSIAGLATETYVSEQLQTKQDVISDLATIRSGAEAGATAVQPAALTGYATTSDVSTAISSQTKETWTFTLSDGSTVTKSIVLGE